VGAPARCLQRALLLCRINGKCLEQLTGSRILSSKIEVPSLLWWTIHC
jgi:hypothetical protein